MSWALHDPRHVIHGAKRKHARKRPSVDGSYVLVDDAHGQPFGQQNSCTLLGSHFSGIYVLDTFAVM